MQAVGKFKVKNWDEKPYDEPEGGIKLNKATVTYTYEGDIAGESLSESLLAYPTEKTSTYVGLEKISGSIGGKKGSFVLQSTGTYDGTNARADSTIIEGSGTGELRGITGTSKMEVGHDGNGTLTIDYDFE